MPNQRLASRYAKSLLDLAVEQKTLEAVYADIKAIAAACKNSRELVNLLQSPIVNADKKTAVMQSIATTAKFQPLTFSFIKLLINKNRESDLPYIA
ncbi:MAG: F0F1 ATP synthase subunit delta, partial [Chitinophagaceae bacterium]